jgi:hypothetical protein
MVRYSLQPSLLPTKRLGRHCTFLLNNQLVGGGALQFLDVEMGRLEEIGSVL